MPAELFLDDPDPQIAELEAAIDAARAESYPLTLSVCRLAAPPDQATALLDAFVAAHEYEGLGEHWVEVPRRIAAKLLAHLIGSDLAYPDEVVPEEQAEDLAARFLALFPPGTRYFTNGACSGPFAIYNLAGEEVLGWRSISPAPFDNGVIALAPDRVGMLWAEDAP